MRRCAEGGDRGERGMIMWIRRRMRWRMRRRWGGGGRERMDEDGEADRRRRTRIWMMTMMRGKSKKGEQRASNILNDSFGISDGFSWKKKGGG